MTTKGEKQKGYSQTSGGRLFCGRRCWKPKFSFILRKPDAEFFMSHCWRLTLISPMPGKYDLCSGWHLRAVREDGSEAYVNQGTYDIPFYRQRCTTKTQAHGWHIVKCLSYIDQVLDILCYLHDGWEAAERSGRSQAANNCLINKQDHEFRGSYNTGISCIDSRKWHTIQF